MRRILSIRRWTRKRFPGESESRKGVEGGKPQALLGRRNDGPPDCRVDGMIVEYDLAILECHAKFLPELVKINRSWLIAHLLVEALQHIGAGGAVSDGKRLFDVPVLADDATLIQDCAQGILQPFAVSRALPNLNVSDKAEHRSSPIRTSPGRRPVQTLVAGGGLSLGHVKNELLPHLGQRKLAHLRSGHRLNVGRNPFFNPVVILRHRGERQVNHLVGQYPIVFQGIRFCPSVPQQR